MSNISAGVIIIGDEILSGRTLEINANFIAKELVKVGINLKQVRIIQDEQKTIIKTVKEFRKSFTYVFTTGGIGPTHDDITSQSIAKAFNKKYCIHPKAFKILKGHYPNGEFTEERQKMSIMPENAELILNPLTVAPGFKIQNVYVLPGVPDIMKIMFSALLNSLKKGEAKKVVTINTNLYESIIAKKLSKIQEKNPECSIGSYPYFNFVTKSGGINIVVSSWKLKKMDHIINAIKKMISLLGGKSSIV